MEDQATGKKVPEVNFADFKAMWEYGQRVKERHPKGGVAVGTGIWKQVCSPDADIDAVFHRVSILGLVEMLLEDMWTGGQLSDNVLKAACKVEMEYMPVGVVHEGFPFDVVDLFMKAKAEALVAEGGQKH
jgi:hypothetical protein